MARNSKSLPRTIEHHSKDWRVFECDNEANPVNGLPAWRKTLESTQFHHDEPDRHDTL
jgi:hypothetical protein